MRLAIQKLPVKAKFVARPEMNPVRAPGLDEASDAADGLQAIVDTVDLTKVYGLGDTFAEALTAAGIDTYQKLADADIDTLREIISTGGTDDQGVNEETWSRQAQYLADEDFEGLDEYVEGLREEDGNEVDTDDEPAADAPEETLPSDGSESAETNAGPNPQNAGGGDDQSDNDGTSLPNA